MSTGTVHVTLTDRATMAGVCDLCGSAAPISALVTVSRVHGGAVKLTACDWCTRAARRLAAVAGWLDQVETLAVTPRLEKQKGSGSAARSAPRRTRAQAELIAELVDPVRNAVGTLYRVQIYGQQRHDGTWIGWLVFVDPGGNARLQTGRETSQSDREGLRYWAGGLEHVYVEGALARAR